MIYRYILTALTAGAILLAFAALPPVLSSSALAQKKDPTTNAINLNSSRSNVNRMGAGGGGHARMGGNNAGQARMGGGGGGRTMGAERMGGGGGTSTK